MTLPQSKGVRTGYGVTKTVKKRQASQHLVLIGDADKLDQGLELESSCGGKLHPHGIPGAATGKNDRGQSLILWWVMGMTTRQTTRVEPT